MTARKLIEEARDRTSNCGLTGVTLLLESALSLLPEWQEFDPKREETWPKEDAPDEDAQEFLTQDAHEDLAIMANDPLYWVSMKIVAYQPLPPPYVKP